LHINREIALKLVEQVDGSLLRHVLSILKFLVLKMYEIQRTSGKGNVLPRKGNEGPEE
jgi:hypothetical protein